MPDTAWLDNVAEDVVNLRELPKEEQLSVLTQLANEQLALEDVIEELEKTLTKRKERLKHLSETKLPELLQAVGMKEFTLTDGAKISDKTFVDARITDPAAFDWLEAKGDGEIVKTEMKFTVRRSQKEELQPILDLASRLNVDITFKEAVHPQTLKAYVSEALRNGQTFDTELFNVYVGHKVTIKRPKET